MVSQLLEQRRKGMRGRVVHVAPRSSGGSLWQVKTNSKLDVLQTIWLIDRQVASLRNPPKVGDWLTLRYVEEGRTSRWEATPI